MKFLLILTVIVLCHQRDAYCQVEKIDSILSEWNSNDKPGGVVAVIKDKEVIYKKPFGLADLRKKNPIQLNTSFGLASIAKQFTAMCIALLEEQGKLSRKDNILIYYPEFQYDSPIKIKNLIDHTSGIREAYVLMQLSGKFNLKGKVPKKFQTKDQLIEVLSKEKDLNFATGSEFAYTNINYILLGDIIEKVSGQKLSEFADSAIFKPLKMDHTFFNDQERDEELSGYYFTGKKYKEKHFTGGIVGDHNLVSTMDDIIIWCNNINDNQLGKKDQDLYTKLYSSSTLSSGKPTEYGYGVFVSAYKGYDQIYHGGDNGIHTSVIRIIPDLKLTIIGMTNSSRYDQVEEKTQRIVDLFIDKIYEKDSAKIFEYISLDENLLNSKEGLYYTITEKGLGQIRKVTYENDELYISDNYAYRGLKLNAVSRQYFVAKNPLDKFLHINFSNDATGNTTFHEEYEDLVNLVFTKCINVSYQNRDFLGRYKNESTGAVIKVKSGRNGLKAKKGIIKLPLIALKKDIFYSTNADALFNFQRDGKGKVVNLVVNAYDFRNFKLDKIE